MTINLEKSLVKENKKLATPKELLIINEYDQHTSLVDNDAMNRVGLNYVIKHGAKIAHTINEKLEQTKQFNQDRVFHISQIKGICNKYRLRFLSARHYKGTVDSDLPNRITNFEIAYGVKCDSHNTMIIAPMESFELQERPKDPLMFYRINNDYYYLIHKWGNDLSIIRSVLPLFENAWFSWLVYAVVPSVILICIPYIISVAIGVAFLVVATIAFLLFASGGHPIRILPVNEWDSAYK